MNILHYSLGFPPYRTGGLTKYCMDLALTQKEQGHKVTIMWPGKIKISGPFVRLKKTLDMTGIYSVEVINPIPVPLDEGISEIEKFISSCPNPDVYVNFLKNDKPDVIHIHTLMGLHKEFIVQAKKLGIKVIFTSHDYFGLCPKVTLYREGQVCDGDCKNCHQCNKTALSMKKIVLMQSPTYRLLKDSKLVKTLRQKHRRQFFEGAPQNIKIGIIEQNENSNLKTENKKEEIYSQNHNEAFAKNYEILRGYYISILELVDVIHFNSSVTESVYRKFIPNSIKGKVINITHKNIEDHRRLKFFGGKLKISFLAPAKGFKGYDILICALDELWSEGEHNFELNMYNGTENTREYVKDNDSFTYKDLENIFDNTDVLIMPSVCYETFGFTVLEALSFGTPVIVSKNVGAKDLLMDGKCGMIIEPTKDGVKQGVKSLIENKGLLEVYNKNICELMELDEVIDSPKKIVKMYEE